jgi:hypothetical protein
MTQATRLQYAGNYYHLAVERRVQKLSRIAILDSSAGYE